MASVITEKYNIDYSIVTGEIFAFEEWNDNTKKYELIKKDYDTKLINFSNMVAERQKNYNHGFSAFLYKLADEGKIVLPTTKGLNLDTRQTS